MNFTLKQVGGRTLLYVMAVDAEYGPHLRQRITPLMTGVGPVEAAVALTRALAPARRSRRSSCESRPQAGNRAMAK